MMLLVHIIIILALVMVSLKRIHIVTKSLSRDISIHGIKFLAIVICHILYLYRRDGIGDLGEAVFLLSMICHMAILRNSEIC